MELPEKVLRLVENLPDPNGAQRFFNQLQEKHSSQAKKLLRANNEGLLADVLALAASSEFLSQSVLQHPDYLQWLDRKRKNAAIGTTEDLLESLARFALTNSALDANVLLARFRRRELLRIFLRDIRGLATVAETTLELSNLADAILEYALRAARQELENRFGAPLEIAPNNKTRPARFVVVALGKLGSKELNYASDIDLLFLFSSDGATAGINRNAENSISNREFFGKLAERTAKIVGQSTAEAAAYRVDLRLRPHGRVGALAVSLDEAARYYERTARDWERQVLLRARASAGDADLFKRFAAAVENLVYRKDASVANALAAVRESKHKINQEQRGETGFNVKLGAGGIREIEFIAQALQLAFGGKDAWLREPHTLIALGRLADREIIGQAELSALSDAYTFLRALEHRLQMENGLQTHQVPVDQAKRELVARRMNCANAIEFDSDLQTHTSAVSRVFKRVFEQDESLKSQISNQKTQTSNSEFAQNRREIEKPDTEIGYTNKSSNECSALAAPQDKIVDSFARSSPYFAEILANNPRLAEAVAAANESREAANYGEVLTNAVENAQSFAAELAALRENRNKFYIEIAALDANRDIAMRESSRRQTALAEASLAAALIIVKKELARRFPQFSIDDSQFSIGVFGLGKLGSRGMDYGSDLDLVLIYDDAQESPVRSLTNAEFYQRAVEILVAALSSLTREGQLYRVDLRLRPDGNNGALATCKTAFLQYLTERAAIWEWLAYVKLRAISGESEAWRAIENAARATIHERARATEVTVLKAETKRVRARLASEKNAALRRSEIDIKHAPGGLLDVYFLVRFLQLRDFVADDADNRTTSFTLQKLRAVNSLDAESFEILSQGYEFLRRLDHALRLVAGRGAKLPGDQSSRILKLVAERFAVAPAELLGEIAVRTTEIHRVFNSLLD